MLGCRHTHSPHVHGACAAFGKTTQRAKADMRETVPRFERWTEDTQEMERDRGNESVFGKPGLTSEFSVAGGMVGMNNDTAELHACLTYNLHLGEVFHFVQDQPQPQHLSVLLC